MSSTTTSYDDSSDSSPPVEQPTIVQFAVVAKEERKLFYLPLKLLLNYSLLIANFYEQGANSIDTFCFRTITPRSFQKVCEWLVLTKTVEVLDTWTKTFKYCDEGSDLMLEMYQCASYLEIAALADLIMTLLPIRWFSYYETPQIKDILFVYGSTPQNCGLRRFMARLIYYYIVHFNEGSTEFHIDNLAAGRQRIYLKSGDRLPTKAELEHLKQMYKDLTGDLMGAVKAVQDTYNAAVVFTYSEGDDIFDQMRASVVDKENLVHPILDRICDYHDHKQRYECGGDHAEASFLESRWHDNADVYKGEYNMESLEEEEEEEEEEQDDFYVNSEDITDEMLESDEVLRKCMIQA